MIKSVISRVSRGWSHVTDSWNRDVRNLLFHQILIFVSKIRNPSFLLFHVISPFSVSINPTFSVRDAACRTRIHLFFSTPSQIAETGKYSIPNRALQFRKPQSLPLQSSTKQRHSKRAHLNSHYNSDNLHTSRRVDISRT